MELLILLILILINGFFALSEIALVSSKKSRLEQRRRSGSKGAIKALKLLEESENFLSAIQVGITLIGIVTGVYGGMNIADDVAPFFQQFELLKPFANELALVLTIFIITYVSIVLGELVPKTMAMGNPEPIAVKVAPTIYFVSNLFYPFVKLLSGSTNFVNKVLGIKKPSEHLTEAELMQLIKMASIEGVIEKEQNVIHEKVFYFSDKKAKHLMTPRVDVDWIDIDKSVEEIKSFLLKSNHSKIICCKGGLDDFKGVLISKDFFKSLAVGGAFNIEDIIMEPLVLPESTNAQKVLELLRKNKIHFCCVVNEYGGFEGIITLHDIFENIVGQIPDDGEAFEPEVFIREDKSILVSGDAPIETLSELIQDFTIDFETIDYTTVAGFVLHCIGKIPRIGDRFEFLGYMIEVVDIDKNIIDKVLIKKI